MPESSIVVRPVPADNLDYTASSRLQAAGLDRAIKLFERAAQEAPLPRPPQPIVVADYGAAAGHNSLLPIGAAIAVLRSRTRQEHSILVAHTDLPENDFTALFRTLSDDPDTYLKRDGASFASAVGRSFYGQILPSNSVNLGFTAWAIQWLSRVPGPIPDHVVVACSGDESVRTAYERQAAHDWHEFIAFRGRELAPGARLMVMTMALDENGEFGFRPLMAALMDALSELVTDGLLTEGELHSMSVPIVGRRSADFLDPFAPSGRFERLEVEQVDVFNAEDRYWNQYRVDHDAEAYSRCWGAFCRAALFPALARALRDRDPARREQFFDRLETGFAARLAADPQEMQIPMAHVVLVKRPKSQ